MTPSSVEDGLDETQYHQEGDMKELYAATKIISHAGCADGVASAMLARLALPRAEVVMLHYGPQRDNLEPEPGMLFVDMTPPESKVEAFVSAGAICLDHHKKAQWVVESFGDNGVFADEKDEPGVSGAVLAYRHVLKPCWEQDPEMMTEPQMVRAEGFADLCGVRDTWQKDHKDWELACMLREALLFYPLDHWTEWGRFDVSADEMNVGRIIYEKQQNLVEKLAQEVLIFARDEGAVAIAPAHGNTTSDLAEYLRTHRNIGTLATFFYTSNGTQLTLHISMRSTDIDVGELAKQYPGGGGHTNAAGFEYRCYLDKSVDPLCFVREALGV